MVGFPGEKPLWGAGFLARPVDAAKTRVVHAYQTQRAIVSPGSRTAPHWDQFAAAGDASFPISRHARVHAVGVYHCATSAVEIGSRELVFARKLDVSVGPVDKVLPRNISLFLGHRQERHGVHA